VSRITALTIRVTRSLTLRSCLLEEPSQALEDKAFLAASPTQPWMQDRLDMEVPVIMTPVSAIPELIQHEESGLLAPERDPIALAAAMACLAQDKGLCRKLDTNGRALVERECDIWQTARRLAEPFRQVIEKWVE